MRPWLPPDALQTADVAVNHLLGVGEKDFFVVLMNTSPEAAKPLIRLNPDKIAWTKGKTYPVTLYDAGGHATQTTMRDGLLHPTVPAGGLLTAKIEGLAVDVPLFRSLAQTPLTPGSTAFSRSETGSPLGTVTGMLITTFPGFSDAYLYTDATEKDLQGVTLKYRFGAGEWQTKADACYPFEFSLHLADPKQKLEWQLTATGKDGKRHAGTPQVLSNE